MRRLNLENLALTESLTARFHRRKILYMNSKPEQFTIGLLLGMADLYNRFWPEMPEQLRAIGQEAVNQLQSSTLTVRLSEVAGTEEQINQACRKLLSEDIDLLVVTLAPYCSSGVFKPALMSSDVPVLLWPIQTMLELKPEEYDFKAFMYNHGVHGVQDIANVLRRHGRAFGVLHGHWKQEDFIRDLESWAQAGRAVRALQRANPVQVGGHFEHMLDLQIGSEEFLGKMGIKVQTVSLEKFADYLGNADPESIKACLDRYRDIFTIGDDLDEQMLAKTARGESALRSIMAQHDSQACGLNFATLCNDPRIADGLHVAASLLMSEGFGYGGEGDWVIAAFVHSMQQAWGMASFSEIFSVGYKDHRLVLKHWGEGNFRMSREKPGLCPSCFDDSIRAEFAIVDFEFEPGEATLINLNVTPTSNGQLIGIYGEITPDHLPKCTGPRAVFKPRAQDVRKMLSEYAYTGGSHHFALVKGDCRPMLEKLAKLTGFACRML